MASEINVSQLHPSVTSVISSTPSTYVSNTSQTTLFCADVFECGVDNTIKKVSSVSEFLEQYGEPNMTKFGQGAYNVLKWLESGGDAFVLRVLPADAKYAHAILNIKTKKTEGTKKVKDYLNRDIDLDDVFLKPVISYIEVNANAEEILEKELNISRSGKSLDGYADNFILVAYPNGRGEYYNKIGFAISPNKSFDSVYSSKIYDFTVVQYDDSSNYSIVEGPFNVSFDPDAISSSNESLFIEDVINKYSSTVRVKFSTDNYLKVAGTINPDVNPYSIDIIKAQTRVIDDVPETFYCSATGKSEDVHLSVHAYDVTTSMPIVMNDEQVLNVENKATTTENAILALDNVYRKQAYVDVQNAISTMKEAYTDILSEKYKNNIEVIVNKVKTDVEKINTALESTKNEKFFETYNNAVLEYIDVIDKEARFIALGNAPVAPAKLDEGATPEETAAYNAAVEAYNEALAEYAENVKDIYLPEPSADASQEEKDEYNTLIASLDTSDKILVYVNNLRVELASVISDNNISIVNTSYLDKVYDVVMDLVTDTKKVIAYYEVLGDVSDISDVTTLKGKLEDVVVELYDTDKNNLRLNVVKEDIREISVEVDNYSNSTDMEEKKNGIISVINVLNNTFTTVKNLANATISASNPYTVLVGIIDEKFDLIEANLKAVDYLMDDTVEVIYKTMFNDIIVIYDNINTLASYVVVATNHDVISNAINDNIINIDKIDDTNGVVVSECFIYSTAVSLKEKATQIYDDSAFETTKAGIPNRIESKKNELINTASAVYSNNIQSFDAPIKFNNGSDGSFAVGVVNRANNIKNALIQAYKGNIDPDLVNTKLVEFNHIIDANYDPAIKLAIVTLARDLRKDFFYWVDTNLQSSPEDALNWRKNEFNVNTYYAGIFSQDFTFYDEYTGKDVKMTTPYILAGKVPTCASLYGLQFPIAGNTRGLVDGYKKISWVPNETYKEALYLKKINYIEEDPRRTRIGSQLTAESQTSPLSNINNVLTLLDIKKNIERIVEDYQFEFNDSETQTALQSELNTYLSRYISNRSCESINVSVTASDYDKIQKLIRVSATIKFNNIIERIVISLDVVN